MLGIKIPVHTLQISICHGVPWQSLRNSTACAGNLNTCSYITDFRMPWSALAESKEQYSLRWESKYLFQLGEAFDYLLQTGLSVATTEALKYTVLSGISYKCRSKCFPPDHVLEHKVFCI